jgi:hypothetical protein
MADADGTSTPTVVSELNLQIIRLLKAIPDTDFVTVLSHPGTIARLEPQQQQQQQQQVKQ